ncbi:hypothetical protein DS2_09347 [Catenovulum agarivorans DS-2]|uniref:Uncharacterized protein n=1 Tax=Catenovulum agarivorans DS-2 TaxID=1328313 RepID=W7QXX0_9ALTE|nr:hypothetical protein [Catenovulum agarivorans]EWH10140.1 hypothetical protein DS2_09347 [Catenovulum agarivorans DS-2]
MLFFCYFTHTEYIYAGLFLLRWRKFEDGHSNADFLKLGKTGMFYESDHGWCTAFLESYASSGHSDAPLEALLYL